MKREAVISWIWGAHDGISISNTYLLERKYGWTGICVEANPDSFEQLKRNRRAVCVHACLDSTEGFVNFAKRDVMGGIVSADTDNKGIENEADPVIRIENQDAGEGLDRKQGSRRD